MTDNKLLYVSFTVYRVWHIVETVVHAPPVGNVQVVAAAGGPGRLVRHHRGGHHAPVDIVDIYVDII